MNIKQDFIRIVNQNMRIAHKVCKIYGNSEEERQDLLQEMMYQLWKSYSHFNGSSKFSTWMYRVCLNTALTFRSKEIKHKSEPLTEKHFYIAEDNPTVQEDSMALLWSAIGTLSPINKALILLYLDELSYQEMAEITGMTVSNVSVRLVRIKKKLEKYIKQTAN